MGRVTTKRAAKAPGKTSLHLRIDFGGERSIGPGKIRLLELIIDARLRTATSAFEVLTPPNPDFRQLVMGIAVPSLLVVGDNGVVSVETARELQGLNQHLRHEVIANAGHGLPYDKPDEFAAVVRSFLATEIA